MTSLKNPSGKKQVLFMLSFALLTLNCGYPTAPTQLTIKPGPIIQPVPVVVPLVWPVLIEDICGYGCEDPQYPPRPDQCPPEGYRPVAYLPLYNGHNFVCEADAPWWREMPRVEGYPPNWRP